jgi:hypothetical protein
MDERPLMRKRMRRKEGGRREEGGGRREEGGGTKGGGGRKEGGMRREEGGREEGGGTKGEEGGRGREEEASLNDAQAKISQDLADFVKGITDAKAKEAFNLCFETFLDQNLATPLRLLLIRQLCLPLLYRMSVAVAIELYSDRIEVLMEILGQARAEGAEEILRKF